MIHDHDNYATSQHSALSPVALAFDRVGVPVTELALRTPTLDDLFFSG